MELDFYEFLALISIHAPREGCDETCAYVARYVLKFQSTHPARGATPEFDRFGVMTLFQSTHPARGATIMLTNITTQRIHFNPRTPRGVRRGGCSILASNTLFQSTHPARGATRDWANRCMMELISIHAPREGCDYNPVYWLYPLLSFQSTHPARGATCRISVFLLRGFTISIHAPREGCDSKLYQRAESLLGSICLFAQGEEG